MKVKRNGVTIDFNVLDVLNEDNRTVIQVSDGSHMFWPTITCKFAKYLEQFLEGLPDE